MKVVVFGATGKLGGHLLSQGLARGHAITVLVRDPSQLAPQPGLVVLRGDVLDPASVAASVAGQDAAVWAVGGHDAMRTRLKRETRQPHLCSQGTGNVLAAMDRHGVRRLVAVTSWGLGDGARRVPAAYRWLVFPLLLRDENQDKQQQEELIRASQLDWTIVRPSRLTDRPATGRYQVGTRLRYAAAASIARADLAAFLLDQLDDPAATRRVVEITQ